MSDLSEPKLFEEISESGVAAPLLFVTNRYNLLEFLSAGYVLPASGIPKYYADLLELCPGRLPLLRGCVTESVAAEVSKEDPSAFPVALSVDTRLAGRAPSLNSDGTVSSRSLDAPAVAFAPTGLLPLEHVSRVHFRTQAELEEHTAREYENVRRGDVELVVSPHVFEGAGLEFDELQRFLAGLDPVAEATAEFFDEIDRLSGAHSMLAALCPSRVDLMKALAALLAGKAPGDKAIPAWLSAGLATDQSKPSGADARLFAAASYVLRHEDRSAAWRPLEVLARIEERMTSQKMPKRDKDEISKNVRPIGAILRNERDFKAFDAATGLAAAKALLLVLLRPDPDRLCSWERSETGADDRVMLAAGVLVGLLRGHKKLPLDLRTPSLDRLLASCAAVATGAVIPDALRPILSDGAITVREEATDDGGAIVRLMWGEDVVVEKVRDPPSVTEQLLASELSAPSYRDVALEICRRQGWSECVSTTLLAPSGQFAVDTGAKIVRIKVPGLVKVEHELDEVAFRARLAVERLPADLEAELRGRLEG